MANAGIDVPFYVGFYVRWWGVFLGITPHYLFGVVFTQLFFCANSTKTDDIN